MDIPRDIIQAAAKLPPAEARAMLRGVLCARDAAESEAFGRDLSVATGAFKADMQPVCKAVAEAMHAGDEAALAGLRALLPTLLAGVNERPELADALALQMGREILTGFNEKEAHRA